MASKELQFLLVKESSKDAEIIVRKLRQGFGSAIQIERIDSTSGLTAALRLGRWHAVIADHQTPTLKGLDALRIVKSVDIDLPFILLTETMGEESAVEMLKAGVDDYVLKDNLERLNAVLDRQLRESESRRERRRSIDALQESEERFRQLADNIDLFFYLTDPSGSKVLYASPAFRKIWGRSVGALYINPRSWFSSVHEEDAGRVLQHVRLVPDQITEEHFRIRRTDGEIRWLRSRRIPVRDRSGRTYRIAGIVEDVTKHKEAEERIRRLNRVHAVLSGINSLIVRVHNRDELLREACRVAVDAGRLKMAWIGFYDAEANRIRPAAWHGREDGFLQLISLTMGDPAQEGRGLVRRAVREKRPIVINDIEHDGVFRLRNEALARGYRSAATLPLLLDQEVAGVISFFASEPHFFDAEEMRLLSELAGDISFALDHIRKEERLNYLALYDTITGLANRTLFLERLNQQIEATNGGSTKVAVIVSDLERFRVINQSLGHHAGDQLLAALAQRMAKALADKHRVSRIGPDQFAVLLPAVKNPLETARHLAELATASFSEPFHIAGSELRISAKAGIALFPDNGTNGETLLRNAEAALDRCKRSGEPFLFFEKRMTEGVARNFTLETRLRRAIEREEFLLHYQPRVSLKTGRITGVEALIRWQSGGGLVPPGEFIPLLEETGLILQVGTWALGEAVQQYFRWHAQGITAPRIAVNVSAVQLRQKDFVARVKRVVEQGMMPPGIDLEITESKIMEDVAGNIEKLQAIRALGIKVAVDDFGTGYSSLSYLTRLPIDSLKIDRSFVVDMDNPSTMTLVSTMISLAQSLKLSVVAEGVDAANQASVLAQLGCDEMQGYLFSKPLPPEQLVPLLQANWSL